MTPLRLSVLLVCSSERIFNFFSRQILLPTFQIDWIWVKNPSGINPHFDFINKKYPEIILFELNDEEDLVFNQLLRMKSASLLVHSTLGVFSSKIEKTKVERAFGNWVNIFLHLKEDEDLHKSNLLDICLLDWQYRQGEFDRKNFLLLI